MERHWTSAGTIVLKFWLQIDKAEQLRRFKARGVSPYKQWKITDEDWRNRRKWSRYRDAVEEMLARTSPPQARWTVVESNCKRYARIKVMDTVIRALRRRLNP
jgi:polyphosphate kinase 2 (PPK2 family)